MIYNSVRRDPDLTERASRYVECTLITLGAYKDPIRDRLMQIIGIVPGERAMTHYGIYPPGTVHTASL